MYVKLIISKKNLNGRIDGGVSTVAMGGGDGA